MPRPLSIVIAAAEAAPYAKVGGLADVAGSLPKALEKLGVRTKIFLPAYKSVNHDKFGIVPYDAIPDFDIPMGTGFKRAEVYHGVIPGSGIDAFLLGCGDYFYRDGIYDDPVTKEGYLDNMERYVFFMKAVLEVARRFDEPIDLIHCHDSQTGLIPGLLRFNWDQDPFFAKVGTLFTIHNMAYQGLYGKETLYWAGIDYRHFYPTSHFEFWGKVNFMKVGIECSELVNTVSETYAKEIQSSAEFGYGLENVLKNRRDVLYGIMNGIDYDEWDPETDPLIPARYSGRDPSGKAVCKSAVLKLFGLPAPKDRAPLVGIVSRLVDQKGLDLIAEVIEEISHLELQLVVLGSGQQKYHNLFEQIARRYPDKIAVKLGFDNAMAHLIEAGADIFLMPSRYEPCGLSQLYSLRYGTVPVVRAVGGLADSVKDYDLANDTGTGFSFKHYSSYEMLIALKRALMVFSDPERWKGIMLRAMKEDWSWDRSARKYLELYEKIYGMKRPTP